jgi:phosphoribosylaminoimidazole-succinocarboxamide synthase
LRINYPELTNEAQQLTTFIGVKVPGERIPELKFLRSGKVRDIYEVDDEHLLIVASDRISAFDCVMPNAIPHKGQVLTQISKFWFAKFTNLVHNHLIATEVREFPATLKARLSDESRVRLRGRAMYVRKGEVVPFECVARGYLAGSGWKEYQQTGAVCGHELPAGLVESSRLPQALFTPATKAESGHDINVSPAVMASSVGGELTAQLETLTLRLYNEAAAYAATRGIIICDTKFEFAIDQGQLMLVDEVLTPDSSRFWPADQYEPGHAQPSFDKQYVRDYLETLDWNKQPPAPALPDAVVANTSAKYQEAFRLLTGKELAEVLQNWTG